MTRRAKGRSGTLSYTEVHDEEALASGFSPAQRRAQGIFFTPRPLVDEVLSRAARWVPSDLALSVVDPACGAGAFLAAARHRLPSARLFGVELSPDSARTARERSGAEVLEADALQGGWEAVTARLPEAGFEVWLGNPPYNGTSSLLARPAEVERIRTLLPAVTLPRGQSLRDDYALFLLRAAHRLSQRPGVLAFVTSASLLDSYLYGPLRQALLEALQLREVLELGPGVFTGARVRTCVTVWTSKRTPRREVLYQQRSERGPFEPSQLSAPVSFVPAAPEWMLRPESVEARALDELWRSQGEPLDVCVPRSFAGLKTRFDELLVDDDKARLFERVREFIAAPEDALGSFATSHELPSSTFPKLLSLKRSLPAGMRAEPERIRRFFRYGGARHRDGVPESDRAWCYLDRRLIPRGDHRFQGDYDPHACAHKLVFNVRELPLAATTIDADGCVHMHRHSRFAPLFVPAQDGERPNLSPRALRLVERFGDPWAAFNAIARFINSPQVQGIWAPAYGTQRVLPVPLDVLRSDGGYT